MRITLFVSSAICAVLLIYAPIETFMLQEYHTYQKDYRELLVGFATSDAERAEAERYPIQIRQLVLPDVDRIDRCISCHVAMEDPRTEGAENPLKPHPGNYLSDHDIQKIGCTVCHDGQGRALKRTEAHAFSAETHWDRPMLQAPFIQANCVRCHEIDELPGLEYVKRGYDLFNSRGCMGCHKLEGKGGQLAPELTNIADASTHLKYPKALGSETVSKVFHGNQNLAYIYESIKSPRAQPDITAMMDFEFTDEEALALTVFLKGLSKRDLPASYVSRRHARLHQSENLQGKEIFAKYCTACHGPGGQGGVKNLNYGKDTIPPLDTLAEKMFLEYKEDAEYVAELLEAGVDIDEMSPPLDVDARARVLAQFNAIKNVIKKGSIAGKADPDGPAPLLNMPNWNSGGLKDADVHKLLAYLLIQFPWEEDEEEELEQ